MALPTERHSVWLKAVPAFFAHEGALLGALQNHPVPRILAAEGGQILLAEVPGEDLYGAPLPRLLQMTTLLFELQREWAGRTDELLALGVPSFRETRLVPDIRAVVDRNASELTQCDRSVLEGFVAGLPQRFAQARLCSIPETLVHGDFHCGNLRGTAETLTLLDWGDSGVGHPMLDESAFFDSMPSEAAQPVRAHWHGSWRRAVPGSDPEHAARLFAPIAAARRAVVYQRFLDNIEPSEHGYHRSDPADWLSRAAALVRLEQS